MIFMLLDVLELYCLCCVKSFCFGLVLGVCFVWGIFVCFFAVALGLFGLFWFFFFAKAERY